MADDRHDDMGLVPIQSSMKHLPRSPTAEYPALDTRRLRLIKAFENYSFSKLHKELYLLAKEDFAISEAERGDNPNEYITRGKMRAASSAFIADYENQKCVSSLLLSIPKRVTEAIIWNNFGYQYMTDESFRKLIYQSDATSDGWGNIARTAEEKENARKAEEIDEAFGRRKLNQQIGERYFTNAMGELEVFYDKMLERNAMELDPSGDIQQIQNPLEAGCARQLSIRMGAHDSSSGLRSSTAPWGLTLSCLEVLKFKVKLVSCPIFKVWQEPQYRLSENLLTSLGGTMVHDGGFNPKQPGTNNARDMKYQYKAEKIEVFTDNPHYQENLTETRKEVGDLHSTLNWYEERFAQCPPELVAELEPVDTVAKCCDEEVEKKWDDQLENFSDLQAKMTETRKLAESTLQTSKAKLATSGNNLENREALNQKYALSGNFLKSVKTWLKDAKEVKNINQAASASASEAAGVAQQAASSSSNTMETVQQPASTSTIEASGGAQQPSSFSMPEVPGGLHHPLLFNQPIYGLAYFILLLIYLIFMGLLAQRAFSRASWTYSSFESWIYLSF
ncbi:hypothetical protein OCU04_002020 [Sclerotinia nivalis]|uniref:Uncharacterized protein n=1 Tax=Sclerotinia nivalis TaxID=352851 RepID=A0A9X0DQ98_9HELO|nr:hypothetical protein OCU04_002020 [Sclerotinia nivalis]